MIHALDPFTATIITTSYLGFCVMYYRATTPETRATRAGRATYYLLLVFILCTCTSYVVQFLPTEWGAIRVAEGWLLAIASLGLLVSDSGTRLGRAMEFEIVLHENDRLRAELRDQRKATVIA